MEYTKGDWKAFVADHFVQVHTGKSTITLDLNEENIANAHLIAAAPALHRELREASALIHNAIRYAEGEYRVFLQRKLKQISKALSQAEGK